MNLSLQPLASLLCNVYFQSETLALIDGPHQAFSEHWFLIRSGQTVNLRCSSPVFQVLSVHSRHLIKDVSVSRLKPYGTIILQMQASKAVFKGLTPENAIENGSERSETQLSREQFEAKVTKAVLQYREKPMYQLSLHLSIASKWACQYRSLLQCSSQDAWQLDLSG